MGDTTYMGGTIEGGRKAAEKLRKRDPNFYREIGAKGGRSGTGGGVTGDPEMAQIIGKLGGRPPKGKRSLARKEQIIQARKALQELNKQRGMI